MKIKYLKGKNWLLALIAGWLGFSAISCSGGETYDEQTAKYTIKGKVINAQNNAVKGIQVVVFYDGENVDTILEKANRFPSGLVDTTSALGEFNCSFIDDLGYNWNLAVRDIDSTINNKYQNASLKITFTASDFIGGDVNFYGQTVKDTTITIY